MPRALLVCVLAISVFCIVPLMGFGHGGSGHLHHGSDASCSACMLGHFAAVTVFLLPMSGFAVSILQMISPRQPIHDQFHPPRLA